MAFLGSVMYSHTSWEEPRPYNKKTQFPNERWVFPWSSPPLFLQILHVPYLRTCNSYTISPTSSVHESRIRRKPGSRKARIRNVVTTIRHGHRMSMVVLLNYSRVFSAASCRRNGNDCPRLFAINSGLIFTQLHTKRDWSCDETTNKSANLCVYLNDQGH